MNPFIRLPRWLTLVASFVLTLGYATTGSSQPTVTVVATDPYAVIGTTDYATLIFTRTGSTASALTVSYTLGGTAVKWTDYCRIQGDMPVAVTIPAGAASTVMTIMARANTTGANPETATFTLAASSAYLIGTQKTATLTLLATSSSPPPTSTPPVITLTATDATATIGTTDTATLVFTRSGATTNALTVNYTLGGTAVPLTDYRLPNGTMPLAVSIPVGASSTTLTIQAVANSTNATPETVTFTLSANSAYTLGSASSATLTIAAASTPTPTGLPTVTVTANDAPAVIGTTDYAVLTFARTGTTTAALTVNYTLTGTAVKWNDYCRIQGDMPVSVTIPAGAASTTMTIMARANSTGANPATAIFTLSANTVYTLGSPSPATITLLTPASSPPPPPVFVPPLLGVPPLTAAETTAPFSACREKKHIEQDTDGDRAGNTSN